MREVFASCLKGKKVSDVFQDYMEPFLKVLLLDRIEHGIHDVPSIEELDKVAIVPWCVWNAVIAESDHNNKIDYFAMIDSSISHMPISVKTFLSQLETRKRREFNQYQYYFRAYKFYYNQQNELRLRVAASMPDKLP